MIYCNCLIVCLVGWFFLLLVSSLSLSLSLSLSRGVGARAGWGLVFCALMMTDVVLNVLGCRVDILGTNCDQSLIMVQYCFTSTETIRLISGRGAQDGHLDFHTAPQLCFARISWRRNLEGLVWNKIYWCVATKQRPTELELPFETDEL